MEKQPKREYLGIAQGGLGFADADGNGCGILPSPVGTSVKEGPDDGIIVNEWDDPMVDADGKPRIKATLVTGVNADALRARFRLHVEQSLDQ